MEQTPTQNNSNGNKEHRGYADILKKKILGEKLTEYEEALIKELSKQGDEMLEKDISKKTFKTPQGAIANETRHGKRTGHDS